MLQCRRGITGQDRAGDYARGGNGCGARDEGLGREGGSGADVAAAIPAIGIKEKEVASVATETISL